jgi:phosphoserine aminotransferase
MFGNVNVVASAEDKNFTYAPAQADWKLDKDAAYVHYTANETIGGVEFHWTPSTGDVPLVCDMSSNILSKPIDVSKYGLIYAGAQKNIGPAGLTIVIVRDDLIGKGVPTPPTMMDYKTHAENESMYNTPPTYGIYIAGLVFQWLKQQGRLAAMEKQQHRQGQPALRLPRPRSFYATRCARKTARA